MTDRPHDALFKAAFEDPEHAAALLRELIPFDEARRAPRGIQALAQLMRYFALVSEPMPFESFRAKIQRQLPGTEEIDMTMTWFEHKQEQARTEGRVDVLRKLLVLKFGPIDTESAARLEAATPEMLDRYLERVLIATTMAAVFAE